MMVPIEIDGLKRRLDQLAKTQSDLAQDMCDLRSQMARLNDLQRAQLDLIDKTRASYVELAELVSAGMHLLEKAGQS